ncbi:MAG: cupin domain-containing protein [Endomicrobiales bacterium]
MVKIAITKKPWGEERLFALTDNYAGKILIIRKGHRLSLQYHEQKEETLYLEEGVLKLTMGNRNRKLASRIVSAGHIFHLPPKTVHRMEAVQNCRLIEVSTPELSDVVRLQDDYDRARKAKGPVPKPLSKAP